MTPLARLILLVFVVLATPPVTRADRPRLKTKHGAGGSPHDDAAKLEKAERELDAIQKMWGSSRWPPQESTAGSQPAWWHSVDRGLLAQVSLLLLVSVCGLRAASSRGKEAKQPAQGTEFHMHLRALAAAILWRHTHARAIRLHFLRLAVPALSLWMIYMMRDYMMEYASRPEVGQILAVLAGASPKNLVDGVIEFALTLMMLYIVMLSNLFFVWHVTAESQSGFRHLLHVSGLSRAAYILATACVDGVVTTSLGLLVMAFVGGFVFELRMLLWTSPLLVCFVLFLLAVSTISSGYLLALLCPGSRFASTLAQVIMMLVIFLAPISNVWPTTPVLDMERAQWLPPLVLPTLPAYRALFELVAACAKGRCLSLADVLSCSGAASPWTMVVGKSKAPDFTPPEELASFVGLVMTQTVVIWILLVLLDWHHNPPLHDSGVAQGGNQERCKGRAVLEVEALMHRYGWLKGIAHASSSNVLSNVSFSVASGAMLGLLGPNGAGKTTAIRCIIGEERPCQGRVIINTSCSGVRCGAYVGLCPQETVVNGDLTVAENLLFFARVRGRSGRDAQECLEDLLVATNLFEKSDCLPDTLSGGMRRRLAVGCAMVACPAVAILDEPTTGLDPVNRRGIWSAINRVRAQGGCCLLTTHLLEEAEALCNHIVVLAKGEKAAEGSVQSLKEQWGKGYLLNVDCAEGKTEDGMRYVESLLSEEDRTPIKSSIQGQVTYKFTQSEEDLGHLVLALADGKDTHGIQHWGVSQASLEDAYIRILEEAAETAPC